MKLHVKLNIDKPHKNVNMSQRSNPNVFLKCFLVGLNRLTGIFFNEVTYALIFYVFNHKLTFYARHLLISTLFQFKSMRYTREVSHPKALLRWRQLCVVSFL